MEDLKLEITNNGLRINQDNNILRMQADELFGVYIDATEDTKIVLKEGSNNYIENYIYDNFYYLLQMMLNIADEKLPDIVVDKDKQEVIWHSYMHNDDLKISYAQDKSIVIEGQRKDINRQGIRIHLLDKERYYLYMYELYLNLYSFQEKENLLLCYKKES